MISISGTGNTMAAKLSYLELSYYSAPKEENIPDQQSELYKPGDYSVDYQSARVLPLVGAQLYFTFDGQKLSASGGTAPACDPATTDAAGEAACTFTHYIDASGAAKKLEERQSCGSLLVEFRGMQSGASNFKPSSQSFVLCPKKSAPLSTFGSAIYAAISKPSNMALCFPALLIAGLLIASMYYSGRDPFSLFDITTPRMPKGKPFRVTAGGALMSINSAIRMYQKSMRTSKKAVAKAALAAAGRGYDDPNVQKPKGVSRRQWKKRMQEEIDGLYRQIEKELADKKNISDFDRNKYNDELMRVFAKYGPDLSKMDAASSKAKAIRNLYGQFEGLASRMLTVYFFMHQSLKIMTDARSGGGSPWKRFLIKTYDKLQRKENVWSEKIGKTPILRTAVKWVPGMGLLGTPGKLIDVARAQAASRRGARIMYRLLLGQALYGIFFTTKEGGENQAYKNFRRLFKKEVQGPKGKETKLTALGKFSKWYHKWDPDKAFERHNIIRKKIDPLFNHAEYTRMQAAYVMSTYNELYESALLQNGGRLAEELRKIKQSLDKNKASDRAILRKIREIENAFEKVEKVEKAHDYTALKTALKTEFENLAKLAPRRQDLKDVKETFDRHLKEVDLFSKLRNTNDPAQRLALVLDEALKLNPSITHNSKDYKEMERRRDALKRNISDTYSDAEKAFVLMKHQKNMEAIEWKTIENFQDTLKKIWAQKNNKKLLDLDKEFKKDPRLKTEMETFVSSNLYDAMKNGITYEAMDKTGKVYLKEKREALGAQAASLLKGVHTKEDFEAKVLPSAFEEVHKEFMARSGASLRDKEEKKISYEKISVIMRLEGLNERIYKFLKDNGRDMHSIKALADPLGQNFGVHLQALFKELKIDLKEHLSEKELAALNKLEQKAFLNRLSHGEVQDMKEVEMLFAKSGVTPKFRQALWEAFAGKSETEVLAMCKKIGLANSGDIIAALRQPANKQQKELADSVLAGISELAHRSLDSWTAKLRLSTSYIYGDAEESRLLKLHDEKSLKEIRGVVSAAEQFDYQALRKELRKSEGYGQYAETLMSMMRGYNRIADLVLWGEREGGTWMGSTLGFYRDQRQFAMQSHGTQASMYAHLLGVVDRRFKDQQWLDDVKNKTGITLTNEFNADAYLALQNRGLLFRDYNKGMAFTHSADHRGALVFMDYEFDVKEGKIKPVVVKDLKGMDQKTRDSEMYNMMPLLARITSSPYAENQYGVILIQQDKSGKWRRRAMVQDEEAGALYGIAEATHSLRTQFAQALAEAKNVKGDDFKWKAISASDYIDNYMNRARKWLVEKPGSAYAHLLYGAFYDQTSKQTEWYVAQAQTRFALQTVPMLAKKTMAVGGEQLNAEQYLANPKKVPTTQGLFSAKYGLNESQLDKVSLKAQEIVSSDYSTKFKQQYRQKQFKDIAEFENEAYARQAELKALRKLGYLNKAMESDLEGKIKSLHEDYKELKKEFKDFRKVMVELTGSHDALYGSKRSIATTWPLWFNRDWRYEQGLMNDFYNVVESSTMRSTITSLGGQTGFEYAYYMGYETGQGMYERSRFWAVGPLWEQQMIPWINITQTVHKFFAPLTSSYYRSQAAMPSYFQKSEMQPGDSAAEYRQSPSMLIGLHAGVTDFFRGRYQNIVDYSGLAGVIGAFRATRGGQGADRGWFMRSLDSRFLPSTHVGSYAQIWSEQRYLDKYKEFERLLDKGDSMIVNKSGTADKDRTLSDVFAQFTRALEIGDVSAAKQYAHIMEPYVPSMVDVRVEGQKRGYLGEMFFSDGAKDRFMNLYLGFHINTWKPIVPGMVDINPMTDRMFAFPQIAAPIDRAKDGENLAMLKTFEAYEFNEKTGQFEMREHLQTHKNAFRDAYWRMEPALLHLMREQSNEMALELFNPYARLPPISWLVKKYRHGMYAQSKDEIAAGQEHLNNLVLQKTGMTMGEWQYGVNLARVGWDEEKLAGPGTQHWYEKTWMIKRIHRILATKWERTTWQWKETQALLDGTWIATLQGKEREPISSWKYRNMEVAARLYKLQKGGYARFYEAPKLDEEKS